MFIAARDELEEQVRGVLIKGNIAHFIADEHAVSAQPREFCGQFATGVSFL